MSDNESTHNDKTSIGPIKIVNLQPLIEKINGTTRTNTLGQHLLRQQQGSRFRERTAAHEEDYFFFRKTILAAHIELSTRRELFSRKANSSCTEPSVRNGFCLVMRNTFQQKTFSQSRASILDDVVVSLPRLRHSGQQTQVRIGTVTSSI